MDIAHWAGLGGVRYIPADYIDVETEKVLDMTEEDLRLTNQRNMELVATLRNTDSAFSLGEGPPPLNVMCVRFGMVTMETEVEELLSLVINCGKDIDEAVTQLHTMSEVRIHQSRSSSSAVVYVTTARIDLYHNSLTIRLSYNP